VKKTLTSAAAIALVAGSAMAADLPSRKAAPVYVPAPPPIAMWTGFYAGLNIGGGWGANGGNNNGGVVGGGQIGYNYQFSQFLAGVEADIQGTSMSHGRGNISLPWFGTVRGRVGYLVTPTLLLYGTGGFAYGGVEAFNQSNTRTGWTAGGGAEWMFMPNWSAKIEYLYTDLSAGGVQGGWGWNYGYNRHPQFNTVRAGVNYHFNFGAPAPIVAKY
jgi:outer membrane immunogenic protein